MNSEPSLPHLEAPHDALRFGIPSFKSEATPAHPVQAIIAKTAAQRAQTKRMLLQRVYGSAFPMKMDIERQILSRSLRLPGLPSSFVGLESLTGSLEEFGFEDYLGDPRDSEYGSTVDLHTVMETRLGMSKGPAVPHRLS